MKSEFLHAAKPGGGSKGVHVAFNAASAEEVKACLSFWDRCCYTVKVISSERWPSRINSLVLLLVFKSFLTNITVVLSCMTRKVSSLEGSFKVAGLAYTIEQFFWWLQAFYDASLKVGFKCNGPPGPRPQYGQGVFAAFVKDKDDNNIEAIYSPQPLTGMLSSWITETQISLVKLWNLSRLHAAKEFSF